MERTPSNKSWIILVVTLLVICCLCLCAAGFISSGTFMLLRASSGQGPDILQTLSPNPTATWPGIHIPPTAGPTPTPRAVNSDPDAMQSAYETLKTLEEAVVPINDPVDLALRLKGIKDVPSVVEKPLPQLNEVREFWATNIDTNEQFKVKAKLAYITPHSYFWIEEGTRYNARDLKALADTFEEEIYPTNQEFFGSEWTPGIDNDEHLYLLYASNLGGSVAGYFSSVDSLPAVVHPYSNEHEMFVFNTDTVGLNEEYTYGVLAHEFQHMIHWYHDRNEESWLNEGFAELAVFLNGYGTGFKDHNFLSDPANVQLNDWPTDFDLTLPHYGASFMFVTYFLDRFGEDATKALVAETENGMESVDKVLLEHGLTETNGEQLTADQVFMDWVTANYLQDGRVADGRFTYHNYEDAPQVAEYETVSSCKSWSEQTHMDQYAGRYYKLDCDDTMTLIFQGETRVQVLPQVTSSGQYAFWSNKGDESDMTLTQTFDLTGVTGPVELSFQTWYDLEVDYDFVYLEASTDGETWEILKTPRGTDNNISGNNYGWGWNGTAANVWVEETVDISKFAGQKVTLRFEYVTDAAVNGEGMLIDDIRIDAIDYRSDFETDDGGWEAKGFVRIEPMLPQTFSIRLIKHMRGGGVEIEDLMLDENQYTQATLNFGTELNEVDVIVAPTTRFTRSSAFYSISLE